jgi:hypothetical protein
MRLLAAAGAGWGARATTCPFARRCLVVPLDGSDGWCRVLVRDKECPLAEMSVEFKEC